uniref:MT domain-containing protein n=1 Tax=Caenorhabditis japonica TaxID=281687 RepID=A0A8R1HL93_CAEJA
MPLSNAHELHLTSNFSERHTAETWQESVRFVANKPLFIKLATCDPEILTVDQMKILKKYVERTEFSAKRIENESIVCAGLCKWIGAFLELACTLRLMEEQVEDGKELREQIRQIDEKCAMEMTEMEELKADVEKLTVLIRENDQTLANDRRLCDYRLRSGDLLSALSPHRNRWKVQLGQNEKKTNELVGNTLLFSIYRALLLCQEKAVASTVISMCNTHLHSLSVSFDSSVATLSNVIAQILGTLRSARRFPLFVSPTDTMLANIRAVLPGATYVDMSQMSWTDSQMASTIPKLVYSIFPTVFFNVTEVPPPEMYEILMRSEEREICYRNKSVELPDDILFVCSFAL